MVFKVDQKMVRKQSDNSQEMVIKTSLKVVKKWLTCQKVVCKWPKTDQNWSKTGLKVIKKCSKIIRKWSVGSPKVVKSKS